MRNWAWPESAKKTVVIYFNRASFRLLVLVVAAFAVSTGVAGPTAGAMGLFQSPVSPAEQPQPAPPQPQPAPPQPQPAQPQPVAPQPQAQPPQPAPEVQPPSQQPVEQPQPGQIVPPADQLQQPAALDPTSPPPLPAPQPRSATDRVNAEEPPASSNLILDRAELVDSVVVSVAYVWLCCGIVLILLIPLAFLFLHIRGRSKIIKEERM